MEIRLGIGVFFICRKVGEKVAKNIKGITIEIGGNTQPLNKSLEGVNKKSRDLQSELKQVDRLLKLDPKNTELLAQKQKLLTDAVGNTKDKLDTLKEAEKQVQSQFEKGEIGEEQYREIQREVIKAEQNLKSLEGQLKTTNNKWQEAGDKLKDVGGKMQDIGKKTSDVGTGMTKGITAPIAAIGGASIAAFNEVDAGLDTIVTKTGASGEALDSMNDSFKKVYGSIPVDAQAVGDAIGEVNTQYGLMGEELEKVSEQALKFSEINGQDVTSTVTDSKAAMEAFGLSAKDVPGILDSVTTTAQNTGVATDKLFDGVTKGAPQLKSLGLNFAESAQLIGQFEQKGIDSSKALSYLSKAQVTWAKDGKSMTEGLADLSDKVEHAKTKEEALTIATEAFGTKGATFMLDALERGALGFEDLSGASEKAAGAVTNTFEGTLDPIDNFQVSMNNLKVVGNDIASAMQEALAPSLEKVVEKLQQFAEWFGNLNPKTQETIVKIGALLAAIGPVVLIIGKVISVGGSMISIIGGIITAFGAGGAAAGALGTAFTALTGPIGIAVAAIAGIVAIGVTLYKNWDTIKEKAGQLGKNISEKWDGIKKATSEKWNNVKESIGNAIDTAKEKASSKAGEIKDNMSEKWENVKSKTSDTWGNVKDTMGTAMDTAKKNVTDKLSNIKKSFDDNGGGIKGVVAGAMTAVKDNFSSQLNIIDKLTGGKLGDIKNAFSNKMDGARDAVKKAIDKIKGFFDFKWELPKLKMPHFNISGKFSLNPPSAPKFGIDWYKNGAIFTKPTIFNTPNGLKGFGEAGAEAALPIEKLDGIIASAMKKAGGNMPSEITVNSYTVLDGEIVAQSVNKINLRNDRRFKPA